MDIDLDVRPRRPLVSVTEKQQFSSLAMIAMMRPGLHDCTATSRNNKQAVKSHPTRIRNSVLRMNSLRMVTCMLQSH